MSNDGPNYSRNIVRRRQFVPVVVMFSFVVTTTSVWVGVANLIDDRTDIDPHVEHLLVLGSAFLSGILAAVLAGVFAPRVHRSIWPESPNEG